MNGIVDIGAIVALLALTCTIWRDGADRRKVQAQKVACWLGGETELEEIRQEDERTVTISNTSDLPVYDVVVSVDIVNQESFTTQMMLGNATYIQEVPPGKHVVFVPWQGGATSTHFGASITFRDCVGNWWRRDAVGNIKKSKNSVALYNLKRPITSMELYTYK